MNTCFSLAENGKTDELRLNCVAVNRRFPCAAVKKYTRIVDDPSPEVGAGGRAQSVTRGLIIHGLNAAWGFARRLNA